MTYTIIKDSKIQRIVSCRPSRLSDHLQEMETAIEGAYSQQKYRIDENGKPIERTEAERLEVKQPEPINEMIVLRALVKDLREAGIALPRVMALYQQYRGKDS